MEFTKSVNDLNYMNLYLNEENVKVSSEVI